jgi:hypothetical protein
VPLSEEREAQSSSRKNTLNPVQRRAPLIPAGRLGSISMKLAKEKAALEIAIYKERLRLEKEAAGEIAIGELLTQARAIATDKRKKRKGKGQGGAISST